MIRITPTGTATLITDKPRAPRLTARRIGLILGGMIVLPFILTLVIAMGAGLYQGITTQDDAKRGPSAHTLDILRNARATSTTPCWAEWNETQASQGLGDGFEVICAAR